MLLTDRQTERQTENTISLAEMIRPLGDKNMNMWADKTVVYNILEAFPIILITTTHQLRLLTEWYFCQHCFALHSAINHKWAGLHHANSPEYKAFQW